MRVLNVTETYYPFLKWGGPPVKVRALSRGLAARHHHVTVLTADFGIADSQGFDSEKKDARMEHTPLGWRMEESGVETIYLPSLLRYRALTWNPGVGKFCRERLGEFDAVHIFGLYDLLGPAVAAACKRRTVPYVLEPIGMFRPIVRKLWLKRLYHRWVGGAMIRGCERMIATSRQEFEELAAEDVPVEKLIVRRNGVYVPDTLPEAGTFRRQWNLASETTVILFLGRLVGKKSPGLLLEAFARWRKIQSNRSDARLVFAGPQENDGTRAKLETLAGQLGVQGEVLYTGPLFGDHKWAAYRDADVFVLPSQNENFGNTAAEAIACGTPAIITENCGIAPLVGPRAGVIVKHNVDSLAEALDAVLGDKRLYARLANGCAEVTRSLGWDEPIAEMEALYKTLALKKRRT
ncbi:MAG TPA: glycosyltransferase [Candidatus Dormibacteraeota bacterium]|nr:glycosyltransferase [Candidatus Dormibacteraeota bacterium]